MNDTAYIATKLATGAIAAFLAIILWSRTRDSAWMLIVIGAVASYADIIYTILSGYGILDPAMASVEGVPLMRIVFANLPTLFYSIGFLIMIVRKRI